MSSLSGQLGEVRQGEAKRIASAVGRRSASLIMLTVCGGVLMVAWMLEPSGAGPAALGTHTRLGMTSCGFHDVTGLPCATCGMTTAFSLAADGRLVDAFRTQPVGAMLAVLCAMLSLVGGWGVISGASLRPLGVVMNRPRTFLIAGGVLIGGWAYKIVGCLGLIG